MTLSLGGVVKQGSFQFSGQVCSGVLVGGSRHERICARSKAPSALIPLCTLISVALLA